MEQRQRGTTEEEFIVPLPRFVEGGNEFDLGTAEVAPTFDEEVNGEVAEQPTVTADVDLVVDMPTDVKRGFRLPREDDSFNAFRD